MMYFPSEQKSIPSEGGKYNTKNWFAGVVFFVRGKGSGSAKTRLQLSGIARVHGSKMSTSYEFLCPKVRF